MYLGGPGLERHAFLLPISIELSYKTQTNCRLTIGEHLSLSLLSLLLMNCDKVSYQDSI